MGNVVTQLVDITLLDVDAVVNAANEHLAGGGGVDGAIHRAAGPGLLAACQSLPASDNGIRCPTGQARLTPGFALPARFVIHTVGPVWRGGRDGKEAALLESAYRNTLALAREHGFRTLAFPAISAGVFGFPLEDAADIGVREIARAMSTHSTLQGVTLVAIDARVESAWVRAVRRHFHTKN
jgi:O-acetyl-ADP-ribose deacetylase (regulator of RNase III)